MPAAKVQQVQDNISCHKMKAKAAAARSKKRPESESCELTDGHRLALNSFAQIKFKCFFAKYLRIILVSPQAAQLSINFLKENQ